MKNKDKINEMFNKAIREKTVLSVQLNDPSPWKILSRNVYKEISKKSLLPNVEHKKQKNIMDVKEKK